MMRQSFFRLRTCFKNQTWVASRRVGSPCGPATRRYVFSVVAAGFQPAVEPGILPGGYGMFASGANELTLPLPGGKMPPSTSGWKPDATLNTYEVHGYSARHSATRIDLIPPKPAENIFLLNRT